MRYHQRRWRWLWKSICFSGLTCLFVYLFHIIYLVEQNIYPCVSTKPQVNEKIKYIFNLDHWRGLMVNYHHFFVQNQTVWCDIPAELRMISDAICRMYNANDCKRLPCHMIYSSPSTLEDVKCLNGGRVAKINNDNSVQKQHDLLCKRGFSLDLFLKKSDNFSYPSIIADAFSPLSDELYINVLNNKLRTCDSIWGLKFNFESISNYPWAADHEKLKLFDVTFGYDRLLYDFIPAPWLFNYVEQLKMTSKRLSMQKAMDSKKPIHSVTTSDVYWINAPTLSSTRTEKNNSSSYVTAPILWMNSNCQTVSKRTEYMLELRKFIDVDNYGTCGDNIRSLPEHIVKIQNSMNRDLRDRGSYNWETGKLALSSEYLFTIAIENSLNHDYITEKLWHALIAGSVPIYLGAPNVEDWLPCGTNCIIDLRKFKTPKDAALYVKTVAMNRTLYETYHQWRNEPSGLHTMRYVQSGRPRRGSEGNKKKAYSNNWPILTLPQILRAKINNVHPALIHEDFDQF